ncbi:glycosyl transferase family 28 [Geodermatophilus sp. YIM 151500]|uniref:glycosyltransferase n=1 Tax=Geodermatophilus sp. YIM 151500 TaxID=2984531 RepID=UPI0021E370F2|nr:glycosyltransferase [Geodermatophilus sp. YIM 151500]MCV2491121.1 glycosyl transferase family 28 [Geodermatophilus sp. YIM 151500]
MIEPPADLVGRKLLLCASTGGHLWQLERIARGFDPAEDSLWVTFDSPQSRALLAGRRVLWVPYISPRDLRGVLRASVAIERALRRETFDGVVSTGAGIALSTLVPTGRRRMRRLYIESVSRVTGPSLTGRIVHGSRLFETWAQHPGWATGRWSHHGSVLGDLVSRTGEDREVRRVFVTLGTIKPYQFRRLVDRVSAVLPADVDVVWQLGSTEAPAGLRGTVHAHLSPEDFAAEVRRSDVVVTHAGVGSVIGLVESGVFPVVVPRRAAHGEHVDDHQQDISELVGGELELALVREADELELADLAAAASREVAHATQPG